MHLGYTPKVCLSIVSNCFLVGLRELEDYGYAKFGGGGGVKRVHSYENGEALEINATLVENDFRMKEMNAKRG